MHSVVIKNYLKLIVKVRFTCEVEGCGRDYSRKSHFETAYEECYEREDVKQGRFICSQCDKSFYHATRLIAHWKITVTEDSLKDLYGTNIIVLGIVLACAISYSNKDIEVSKLEDIS